MKNKWYEKTWVKWAIGIGVPLFAFFGIPMIIKALYSSYNIFHISVDWEAKDALAYAAAILSSISTIVLGIVAFKQNRDLSEFEAKQNMDLNNLEIEQNKKMNQLQEKQNEEIKKIQESDFVANNACMYLIKGIELKKESYGFTNSQNQMNQYIIDSKIKSKDIDINNREDIVIKMIITLKKLSGIASGVRAKELLILGDNEIAFYGKNDEKYYTHLAISEDGERFEITMSLSKLMADNLCESGFKNLSIDLIVDFVTPENVLTKIKCRSKFSKSKVGHDFDYKYENSQLFWEKTEMTDNVIYRDIQ